MLAGHTTMSESLPDIGTRDLRRRSRSRYQTGEHEVQQMKYTKEWKDGSGSEELTYDQARELVSRCYAEDAVDEILSHPHEVNCRFSTLIITED